MFQVKVIDEGISLGYSAFIDIIDTHVIIQVETDATNEVFMRTGNFMVIGDQRIEYRLALQDILCLKVDERGYKIKFIVCAKRKSITVCFSKAVEVQKTTFVLVSLANMLRMKDEWLEDFVGQSMLRLLNEAYFITHNLMPQFLFNKNVADTKYHDEKLYVYLVMEKVVKELKFDFKGNIQQMRSFLNLDVNLSDRIVLEKYKDYLKTSVPYCWTQFLKHFPISDVNNNIEKVVVSHIDNEGVASHIESACGSGS